jgi:preprotein translocase subunit SecE
MVERRSPKPDVEGSSPSWPVKIFPKGAGMKKIIQFFRDSYGEMRKVVWPSRDDVISSTKVVVISTIIVSLILSLFDLIIYDGLQFIFRIG